MNCLKRLLVFLLTLCFWPNQTQAQLLEHVQGEILVQLKKANDAPLLRQQFNRNRASSQHIQFSKALSPSLHIYSLNFNHNAINERILLQSLRDHPNVLNAQFNHLIHSRVLPNDPNFSMQWHFLNMGSNGGLPGADLGADQAWDISHGGISPQGDTIVICIIDDGFDAEHVDLAPNHWRNWQEIPNNGMDDDGNGYIDDVFGWNVVTEDDELSNTPTNNAHGTAVAGIVGARGNNGIGISGVNWEVKLMLVLRGNTTADAVAAYEYPLKQRRLYQSSNGQRGAFVVATNASWGIPYRWPSDAPIWCAMYDSLGQAGILNCAATANLAINVDQVGDLPTTCPSDYIISVTNINNRDEKVSAAAYGPLSVDLGAYGQDIFTLAENYNYGPFSGTSAASPMVAGAIGLLYAAPCPSFIALAKAEPAAAALLARQFIIEAASPNSNLSGLTSSGKRLHLARSLNQLMAECNFSGCYNPFDIQMTSISTEAAEIKWKVALQVDRVNLRYRKVSDSTWNTAYDVTSPFLLDQLNSCSRYEFQLQSRCDTTQNTFSNSTNFETKGCCRAPTQLEVDSFKTDRLFISWQTEEDQLAYEIRFRPVGGNWLKQSSNDALTILIGLDPCTEYEIQVRSLCQMNRLSPYSSSLLATTAGCSICREGNYCSASGPSNPSSWISEVSMANLLNPSAKEFGGYSDFTNQSVRLAKGLSYPFFLKTDHDFFALPPYISVWIDLDQNGSFEEVEELLSFQAEPNSSSSFSGTIRIPAATIMGSCRMRVAAWSEQFDACHHGGLFGEVEDYCVEIVASEDCLPPLSATAQVSENELEISWRGSLYEDSYILRYRAKGASAWLYSYTTDSQQTLKGLKACTDYEYQLQSVCTGEEGDYSSLFEVRTLGCGSCLDLEYCKSQNNASFEWLETFELDTFRLSSGNDLGYGDYTDYSLNLETGTSYPIHLFPQWANEQYQEFIHIYMDFNQNGDFDDTGELVFSGQTSDSTDSIAGQLTIPAQTAEGSVRLRMVMKYNSAPASACESGFYGEVEDYCVNIGAQQCPQVGAVEVNTFYDNSAVLTWDTLAEVKAYNIRYRLHGDSTVAWDEINVGDNTCLLSDLIPCRFYDFQLRAICRNGLSNFTPLSTFESSCSSTSTTAASKVEITVFPNPFQNEIQLSTQKAAFTIKALQLLDIQGRVVFERREEMVIHEIMSISFPNLNKGIYFLKIQGDKTQATYKLVKM